MGNTYISNTIDLIDAITDCNNCNCDKQENERCSRCDFCVIPNYVKVGCTDNTIIGEHILTSKHKSVKLIRNPKSKTKSKSKSKYIPPIMPPPIKIQSSMTYFNDNGDDSSSMDRVIATIEPYPLPPTPSNSPCDHYYIPGNVDLVHSNSSSPHSTSMGSPLTPLSTNGTSYRYQNPNRKNRSSPNSASEYSTVDMNTSNDNKEDDSSASEYNEEIYKRQIQKAIIERNTFYISQSYADDNHSSHSSSYMSDIPEEDVVEIKLRKNSNSNSCSVSRTKKKQKRNSLVPKFEEEIDDNGNDQELILKEIKHKKNKKMRQFKPRHVPSSKDAMF